MWEDSMASFLRGEASLPSLEARRGGERYLISTLRFDLYGRSFVYGRDAKNELFLALFSPQGEETLRIARRAGPRETILVPERLKQQDTALVDSEGNLYVPCSSSLGCLTPEGKWELLGGAVSGLYFVGASGDVFCSDGQEFSGEPERNSLWRVACAINGANKIDYQKIPGEVNFLYNFIVPTGEAETPHLGISTVDGVGFAAHLDRKWEEVSNSEIFLRKHISPDRIFYSPQTRRSPCELYYAQGEKVYRADLLAEGPAVEVCYTSVSLRLGRSAETKGGESHYLSLGRGLYLLLE